VKGIEMKTIRSSSIILIVCCWGLFTVSTQAQEFDAQKLLLDSISYDKLDVAGVKTALGKGANPNWVSDTKSRDGTNSVLGHLTRSALSGRKDERIEQKAVEILQVLVRAGTKLQACDEKILFYPISSGWVLFTELLLKNGANPTREVEGWTPMEIAVRYDQAKIVELLRKHGVPALESRIAAQLRFINAASFGDIPRMDEAIRNGADVNGRNRQGETALVASMPIPVITSKTYSTIQYLLKKGADPTIQGQEDFGRTTALHLAIKQSRFIFDAEIKKKIKNESQKDSPLYARLIIQSLLQNGALVSARDSDGMTPLHIAAKYNNVVGAKMLIDAGSKIMPRDDKGKTPLDYAESAEMIKLLKAQGAKED
jgi:ankyrin repeat protein